MTLHTLRVTFRLHRFEVLSLAILGVATILAAIVVAWRLDALAPPAACFDFNSLSDVPGAQDAPANGFACQAAMNAFQGLYSSVGTPVVIALVGLPFLAGILMGAPIVGREIERGTTRLAWSLASSRRRWFVQRMVPVLGVLAVVTIGLGLAADRLFGAANPGQNPAASFSEYGIRGPLAAAHAVLGFSIAVVVGAVLGRALPAVVVGGVVLIGAIVGVQMGHEAILRGEAIVRTVNDEAGFEAGDRYLDSGLRTRDGQFVSWAGDVEFHEDGTLTRNGEPVEQVQWLIPGSRYPEVAGRETAALTLISVVLLTSTLVVIDRRRPG